MLLVYFTKKQLPYHHFIVLYLESSQISLDIQVENRVTVFLGILILNRR